MISSVPTPLAMSDYRVRITPAALQRLAFEHHLTAVDPTVMADAVDVGLPDCVAGLTEWSAVYGGQVVLLGWDWVLLNDGLALLRSVGPRTNLLLQDNDSPGRPATDEELFAAVDAIRWKQTVLRAMGRQANP